MSEASLRFGPRGPGANRRVGYLAGRDEQRAEELHDAFQDPEVGAIIVSRGGFGSGRLLGLLDPEIIMEHPKPLVGYSDITALLLGMHRLTGLVGFHGPMVSVELADAPGQPVLSSLWKSLDGWYPAPIDLPRGVRPRLIPPADARSRRCPSPRRGSAC